MCPPSWQMWTQKTRNIVAFLWVAYCPGEKCPAPLIEDGILFTSMQWKSSPISFHTLRLYWRDRAFFSRPVGNLSCICSQHAVSLFHFVLPFVHPLVSAVLSVNLSFLGHKVETNSPSSKLLLDLTVRCSDSMMGASEVKASDKRTTPYLGGRKWVFVSVQVCSLPYLAHANDWNGDCLLSAHTWFMDDPYANSLKNVPSRNT